MDPVENFFEQQVDPNLTKELQCLYDQELEDGSVNEDTKYQYAWLLTKSSDEKDLVLSAQLLKELVEDDSDQTVECLSHLIYVNIKMENYNEASKYCTWLLRRKPNSEDARNFEKCIAAAINENKSPGYSSYLYAFAGIVVACGIYKACKIYVVSK